MYTTSFQRGGHSFKSVHADRPTHSVPTIKREYTDDNVRMYETTDGRQFHADRFDQMFKVAVPKKKVLSDKQVNAMRNAAYRKRGQKRVIA